MLEQINSLIAQQEEDLDKAKEQINKEIFELLNEKHQQEISNLKKDLEASQTELQVILQTKLSDLQALHASTKQDLES